MNSDAKPALLPFDGRVAYDDVAVAYVRAGPAEFTEHAHREVEVAVGFARPSGVADWETETGARLVQRTEPGYVSVLPSGQPHRGRLDRPAEVLLVYLEPDRDSPRQGWIADDLVVRALLAPLRAAFAAGEPPSALAVTERTALLRAHLAGGPRPTAPRPARAALVRAADHARAHLDRPVTLGELAAVAGLSPFHFAREFRRSTGLPPHRWLVEARLHRAIELLLRTDTPIAQVALRTGFAGQSHLGRHLKRRHGIAPGQVRRLR